jgi:hypothetical protein
MAILECSHDALYSGLFAGRAFVAIGIRLNSVRSGIAARADAFHIVLSTMVFLESDYLRVVSHYVDLPLAVWRQ